mmetsp:Transcript_123022/g.307232  ORF Transcript_123022/g.307232 Transcript_123022/m.307232 type:complete len:322 (+) Transcript_123022:1000-1965(+)
MCDHALWRAAVAEHLRVGHAPGAGSRSWDHYLADHVCRRRPEGRVVRHDARRAELRVEVQEGADLDAPRGELAHLRLPHVPVLLLVLAAPPQGLSLVSSHTSGWRFRSLRLEQIKHFEEGQRFDEGGQGQAKWNDSQVRAVAHVERGWHREEQDNELRDLREHHRAPKRRQGLARVRGLLLRVGAGGGVVGGGGGERGQGPGEGPHGEEEPRGRADGADHGLTSEPGPGEDLLLPWRMLEQHLRGHGPGLLRGPEEVREAVAEEVAVPEKGEATGAQPFAIGPLHECDPPLIHHLEGKDYEIARQPIEQTQATTQFEVIRV